MVLAVASWGCDDDSSNDGSTTPNGEGEGAGLPVRVGDLEFTVSPGTPGTSSLVAEIVADGQGYVVALRPEGVDQPLAGAQAVIRWDDGLTLEEAGRGGGLMVVGIPRPDKREMSVLAFALLGGSLAPGVGTVAEAPLTFSLDVDGSATVAVEQVVIANRQAGKLATESRTTTVRRVQ
jgi:hypothetical protein